MFSAKQRTLQVLVAGTVAAATLASAAPVHAQAVVVRSTGPSAAAYPLGRKLPVNASVTLKAGDKVTVLDKAGTRILSGPGTFSLASSSASADAPTGTALASLIARTGAGQRTRTGAVRGDSTPVAVTTPRPDSLWYVDVSKGGTWCIADPAQVVMWRPNRDSDGAGRLAAADGSSDDLFWRAGNALKLWPVASVPVADGATYSFVNPVGQTIRFTTRVLASVPDNALDVASVLAEKGCSAQLDLLATAGDSN